ncbi:MAG: 16S rRNA (cytosine967-C5)-methyltransferase [Arenicella sp.]|jgi:16S rRNA (cytosine967-C5)-methyltransferase
MRHAAQLQATIDLLDEIAETNYPADRIMSHYFKQHRYIGSKDKAAISENLYTVLRNRLRFEYILNSKDLGVHSRMLVALLLKMDGGDLYDTFDGDKYSPKRLRPGQLERFAELDLNVIDAAPLNVRLNVPEWISPKLEKALGDRFEEEMIATNKRATTDIRVNTLKSSIAPIKQIFSDVGYISHKTDLSPWSIRFESRVSLFALPAFKQGWFEIQDEGSQLLALLTGAKAGQKIVDFCAGAGGKTLAIAAMMENKGTIYACDVHTKRLEQLVKRSKRAGVHNVRTHILSSEHDKWVKKHAGYADTVLIDAPCTGTGTWRRSPDSRWNLTQESLDNLVALQQSILQSAKRLVKPGGRLLYATCSMLEEENEQQAITFLDNNPEFSAEAFDLPQSLAAHPQRFINNGHEIRTFPAMTGTDGFYVASLRRAEAVEEVAETDS